MSALLTQLPSFHDVKGFLEGFLKEYVDISTSYRDDLAIKTKEQLTAANSAMQAEIEKIQAAYLQVLQESSSILESIIQIGQTSLKKAEKLSLNDQENPTKVIELLIDFQNNIMPLLTTWQTNQAKVAIFEAQIVSLLPRDTELLGV